MESIQKANSGHPGMPMGCAPIAYYLYAKAMKHNPDNPGWINRDRFVLSAGHGSMLLYSILHLAGYDLSMDELKQFRQLDSKTPGHPEYGHTAGVETTTGPLGQGFANAVGMAIAQQFLAAKFNKEKFPIIDNYIYGICSDGDLMEGISHEAASLAGHLGLGKIIFFYDNNGISIDGKTKLTFSEDIKKRFEAYNWHTETVMDVNDLTQIESALSKAQAESRPSLIITTTNIGYGSPNKQDTSSAHGSPLGDDEIKLTKEKLGWEYAEPFYVPAEVREYFASVKKELVSKNEEWNTLFVGYKDKYPAEAKELMEFLGGKVSESQLASVPFFAADSKGIATRQASGKVINAVADNIRNLVGGSADLYASNNTKINSSAPFSKEDYSGRNIYYGIREHAMAAICNGMAVYGGVIPFCSTFLVFADYMKPSIRLAALMKLRVIYVLTHDSIGVGEDGPTHQPVEHIASLRIIPNTIVLRPCDANETAEAWKVALETKGSPVVIALTRQSLPVLDRGEFASASELRNGAYTLIQYGEKSDVVIIASGSEVHPALTAAKNLYEKGIGVRVVSMPSMELFERQSDEYKESVIPSAGCLKVSVEAGVTFGWQKYTGAGGINIGIDAFGASAPEKTLMKKYGFTAENITESVLKKLNKN
ncbi:MAG: transketolase [Ignavibacteriaceae bacterium]|nr:transketolase [Ignavibacteriaceae bacterium]